MIGIEASRRQLVWYCLCGGLCLFIGVIADFFWGDKYEALSGVSWLFTGFMFGWFARDARVKYLEKIVSVFAKKPEEKEKKARATAAAAQKAWAAMAGSMPKTATQAALAAQKSFNASNAQMMQAQKDQLRSSVQHLFDGYANHAGIDGVERQAAMDLLNKVPLEQIDGDAIKAAIDAARIRHGAGGRQRSPNAQAQKARKSP